MKIIFRDSLFIVLSSYAEKDIVKGAGFRWSPADRRWWTDRADVAAKLLQYADPTAVAEIEKFRQQVTESRSSASDAEIPAPPGLSYLPFQKAGVSYMVTRPAVLNADEMGLGKTIQTIGAINLSDAKKILIVCPASLKINWQRELTRWLTRPLMVAIASSHQWPEAHIIILNYDILKNHIESIRHTEWDLLVCDEAHYLKNRKAQRTQYVLGGKEIPPIPAKKKIFLTGTPILNRPIELWPILHSLFSKEFSSWGYFVKRYCDAYQSRFGWDTSGNSNLDELQDRLRALCMVRRLKKDVLTELPPKRRQVIELPANGSLSAIQAENAAWETQQEAIADLKAQAELAKAEGEEVYKMAVEHLRAGASAAFAEISRLRHETALAKVPAVTAFLQDCVEQEEKIIVFAHHRDVIEALGREFSQSVILTGETSQEDRQKAVDRFQTDSMCHLFIGSIKAAGLGLTLTAASHVIFAELDWTPASITQAEDRCHRIGQANSVLVQHLVLEGSLDATMAKILVQKQEVIDQALDLPHDDPVLPGEEAATTCVTVEKIEQEAEGLTPEDIIEIHRGLRILSARCDGACVKDGMGFNKFDTKIGKTLAACPQLSPRQAVLGKRIVHKYRTQLEKEI